MTKATTSPLSMEQCAIRTAKLNSAVGFFVYNDEDRICSRRTGGGKMLELWSPEAPETVNVHLPKIFLGPGMTLLPS